MRLYRKLLLFALAAAVLPLSAVGFHLLASAEKSLRHRIEEQQRQAAQAGAELVWRDLQAVITGLQSAAGSWAPSRLGEAELTGFLRVVLRSSSEIRAAAVLDEVGRLPVPAQARSGGEGGAPPPPPMIVDAFVRALPAREARLAQGLPVVAPLLTATEGRSGLALAVAPAGSGWVVGALADLEHLGRRLEAAAGEVGSAAVLDQDARLVAVSPGAWFGREEIEAARRFRAARPDGGSGDLSSPAGVSLAAWAPVPGDLGWTVLVRVPASVAFADVARMRREVLGATLLTLVALLALGAVVVRGVTQGLSRIDAAAREIARGNLAARLPAAGGDEVAEVSRAFNQMGEELQVARARLERWNEELRAQVEARTLELKEAQARLLESQKLAAVGQLGAGVAHEINNPLTGILGQAQLLLESKPPKDPDVAALRQIEDLARRSRDITLNLLRFSQQKEEPDLVPLDLNAAVKAALLLAERQVADEGMALEVSLAEGLPRVRGDAGQLAHVLLNLLSNARTACRARPAPRIEVETRAREGQAILLVRDNGSGIPAEVRPRIFEPFFTTKQVWSNVGLGLSVSWRIVAAHGGRIEVESAPGEGSTFTVVLPAAP
ncbi:MAG TPA: ATP-binding protein [Anaeromyxobacteraceae bacterium]|nr:ATP-binding protein [Anaeromyxobacteraceae bacterium]